MLLLLLRLVIQHRSASYNRRLEVEGKTYLRRILLRTIVVMLTWMMMMVIVRLLPGSPGRARL